MTARRIAPNCILASATADAGFPNFANRATLPKPHQPLQRRDNLGEAAAAWVEWTARHAPAFFPAALVRAAWVEISMHGPYGSRNYDTILISIHFAVV